MTFTYLNAQPCYSLPSGPGLTVLLWEALSCEALPWELESLAHSLRDGLNRTTTVTQFLPDSSS
ncbi:hypothetical protein P7K49_018559 [Saguinus oedipus]|uniref:Uncharacterized protein n=1 Tax=Saguinus oedipus TaxID=9490 RepID=A0ABQ9V5Q2_SAGOE|nr:hypothetical protein P7K49_018559 [Saguinus oedipus]